MNELKVFNNAEFGKVRTVEVNGKPYFVANDVAKALGYSVPKDAVTRHCKGALKCRYLTEGGEQELKVIPEGDIYRLVIKSQLPTAEKFESWVFDEVLPSIRKHGMYAKDELLENPDLLIAVATELKAEREQNKVLRAENEQLKPKAEFFDAVTDSKDAIDMAQVAKVLNYPGIGRNKLFEILRDNNILQQNNQPYQKYIDNGCFRVIEQKYEVRPGETRINIKTLVFQKGVDYIRKLLDRVA